MTKEKRNTRNTKINIFYLNLCNEKKHWSIDSIVGEISKRFKLSNRHIYRIIRPQTD